jgi:23S rRNA (guanosine2251-2'-O)-methyltransferase
VGHIVDRIVVAASPQYGQPFGPLFGPEYVIFMKNKVFALLHSIRSLHNVGSMFRTADGAGVKRLYLCGETGTPPRAEIAKTALGAEEVVPWEYWMDAKECIVKLKSDGMRIIALELTSQSVDYRTFVATSPVCLVVGNEVGGIPSDILELCDDCIQIPMRGIKESLNVSVSFGIAVYEMTKSKA